MSVEITINFFINPQQRALLQTHLDKTKSKHDRNRLLTRLAATGLTIYGGYEAYAEIIKDSFYCVFIIFLVGLATFFLNNFKDDDHKRYLKDISTETQEAFIRGLNQPPVANYFLLQ
jgi:hypothetical protein